jgi:hypothetical protein
MLIKNLIIGLLAAIMIAGTGCASTGVGAVADNPRVEFVAKSVVQYGIIRFIDEDAEKHAKVVTFVDAALAIVNEDESATLDTLSFKLQALIPFDKLHPADRALIANLIEATVAELKTRVDVPDSVPVAEVRVVLGWVKQAADLSLPR